jgi:hypothetical protein
LNATDLIQGVNSGLGVICHRLRLTRWMLEKLNYSLAEGDV